MNKRRIKTLFLSLAVLLPSIMYAAVGCDLNDPDRDVKRFFPSSTSYKTQYVSVKDAGGEALLKSIEQRLGDKFIGLYETIDVPYTIYIIYKGKEKIGYIHGVNQKGTYGGIQVFLALDTKFKILNLYFQKMTSKSTKKFRDKNFTDQFTGLTINDFNNKKSKLSLIKSPDEKAEADFKIILRGIKKNLILMDVFMGVK